MTRAPDDFWLTHGTLVTSRGRIAGSVHIVGGRIGAIRTHPPRGARAINVRGAYVAPGFIDLHAWGEPRRLAREVVRDGTTAFLTTLGPAPRAQLLDAVRKRKAPTDASGAQCLGLHLEGPFLNPARGGALPHQWMRRPTLRELAPLVRASGDRLRLITLAPELPGALAAIRWCARRKIAVSLGHSDADATTGVRALRAGASAVTHLFNGMRPLHHRFPTLADAALADSRAVAMVIADGIHVGPAALRMALRLKGPRRVALVTNSVRHQRAAWKLRLRRGAYYRSDGTLAGSALTMLDAVRNAVQLGGASLEAAVRMASETPARLLRLERERGRLQPGARADLAVFDKNFRMRLTMVGGRIVYSAVR